MRTIRVVVCLTGIVGLLVMAPMLDRSHGATYGGADPRLLGLEVAAAIALLLIAAAGQAGVATVLLAVVGAAWLAPEVARETSPGPAQPWRPKTWRRRQRACRPS